LAEASAVRDRDGLGQLLAGAASAIARCVTVGRTEN
jgi:hypothetical protein